MHADVIHNKIVLFHYEFFYSKPSRYTALKNLVLILNRDGPFAHKKSSKQNALVESGMVLQQTFRITLRVDFDQNSHNSEDTQNESRWLRIIDFKLICLLKTFCGLTLFEF